MVYAGGNRPDRQDVPEAFGLARSIDRVHWEKYPGNPIFRIADDGAWDDGAIWFGTVFEWKADLFLIHESGRMADIQDRSPALTRVGLARLAGACFDRAMAAWEAIG